MEKSYLSLLTSTITRMEEEYLTHVLTFKAFQWLSYTDYWQLLKSEVKIKFSLIAVFKILIKTSICFQGYNPWTLPRVFNNLKLLTTNRKVNLHTDIMGVTNISSFSVAHVQCLQSL